MAVNEASLVKMHTLILSCYGIWHHGPIWYLVLSSRILQNTQMGVLTGGASGRVVYFLAIDGSNGSAL